MNKKSKHLSAYLAAMAVLSLVLTTSALAAGDNPNQAGQHRGERKDISKTLNLTPEQKEQIQQQRSMNKQKWAELRDKMREKRLELKGELEKPDTDRNKINAIIAEIKTLTGEQLELRVNNILATKQILTPEQFKKLQERKVKLDR